MRKVSGPTLGFRALVLLTGSLILMGEKCPGGGSPPPPPDFFQILQTKVAQIQAANPTKAVAIAVATSHGVIPDKLVLRDDTHFAVWLVTGTSPSFTFKATPHPFEVTCADFLCFSNTVASTGGAAQLDVDYEINFTPVGGAPAKADPHLEVVK